MGALGTLVNAFLIALFAAGILKLFQIHTVLTEIKEQLGRGASSTPRADHPYAPPAFGVAPTAHAAAAPLVGDTRSGEEMLRALDAQMHMEEAARRPEIVDPR
ncbi:MAG: hypothetical protein WDO18_06555 [Acidobacteriota bacterium]